MTSALGSEYLSIVLGEFDAHKSTYSEDQKRSILHELRCIGELVSYSALVGEAMWKVFETMVITEGA